MFKKVKEFHLRQINDYCDGIISQQVIDPDKDVAGYLVEDLSGCPEDATIERDLVSAQDWLEIINAGIKLAHLGYYKAVLIEVEDNDERD